MEMDPPSSASEETDSNPLEPYRIKGLPDSFYYIANFITVEEEASILAKIPPNRWTPLSHRRLQSHPSPLTASSTLLASPLPPWLSTPILPRFDKLGVFTGTKHAAPNHVLVNEYRPGEGIMPHEDGAAYEPVVATVSLGGAVCLEVSAKSSLSDGEEGEKQEEEGEGHEKEKEITEKEDNLPSRIFQERRSLLITLDPAYSTTLHGISPLLVDKDLNASTVANWSLLDAETRKDVESNNGVSERGTRVSLTYRDVRRVSGAVGKVLGRRVV